MKSDIERLYLIDRYLKEELTGLALDEFKSRLKSDPEFAREVESQRALIEGIKLARREQLLSLLRGERQPEMVVTRENEPAVKPVASFEKPLEPTVEKREIRLQPNYNNWYFAAAAILLAGWFLYFIFGYYLPHQRNIAALEEKNGTVQDTNRLERPPLSRPDAAPGMATQEETAAPDSLEQIVAFDDNSKKTAPPADTNRSAQELIVEKDTKTGENSYVVTNLETISGSGQLVQDQNNQVGNPDKTSTVGEFKVKRTKSIPVKVEYWNSIVNFKGYKLTNSTLQLFDVKAEDNVALKYLDKQLYLKKKGVYYRLNASGNFETFQKESSPEVINILESN